jgi:hypothetical protein
MFQQQQNPSNITSPSVWAQPKGAGTAASADITSLTAPGFNTLLPVLQQHAHVW